MSISSAAAARYLCTISDWTIPNLDLQKRLYLANMLHLGRHGAPLVDEAFEATLFGPLLPRLFARLSMFATLPVGNVLSDEPLLPDGTEKTILDEVRAQAGSASGAALVAMTQSEDGAWARHFATGGDPARGAAIPDADIIAEYRLRITP